MTDSAVEEAEADIMVRTPQASVLEVVPMDNNNLCLNKVSVWMILVSLPTSSIIRPSRLFGLSSLQLGLQPNPTTMIVRPHQHQNQPNSHPTFGQNLSPTLAYLLKPTSRTNLVYHHHRIGSVMRPNHLLVKLPHYYECSTLSSLMIEK